MKFSTEKNKLEKLWNQVEINKNNIIVQQNNNKLIIDGVSELNRTNSTFPILTNFSSEWTIPEILEGVRPTVDGGTTIIDGNFIEFRLIFKNVDPLFIPYIHSEIIYRAGTSGTIPKVHNPLLKPHEIPFDEDLASDLFRPRLEKGDIFEINGSDVEYISYMRMDFRIGDPQEIEYKLICYILNPHYYQAT